MNPVLVARLSREYAVAIRNEEDAPTATKAWTFARISERCLRRLQAARAGLPLPSRVTRRSRARQGLAVLAMIGRVIERAIHREISLRKAQIASRISRVARAIRVSLRVVLRTISRLIVSTIGKDKNMTTKCQRDHAAIKLDNAQWRTLRLDGIQNDFDDDGRPAPLELRTCSCGSTLARLATIPVRCHYCCGVENFEIGANGECVACGGTQIHPDGDDPHDDGEGWDGGDCGVCMRRDVCVSCGRIESTDTPGNEFVCSTCKVQS